MTEGLEDLVRRWRYQSLQAQLMQHVNLTAHDDVIQWQYFPRYWPFVRAIHRSPVMSPHKDQWRGVLIFSLICAWINNWVNNREAGDLRRHRAHYDVTVVIIGTATLVLCIYAKSLEPIWLNILRPWHICPHFQDGIFKCIFLISLKISLKFVPEFRINTIPTLVQIITWHRPGDKPLSEPMMRHSAYMRHSASISYWSTTRRCVQSSNEF